MITVEGHQQFIIDVIQLHNKINSKLMHIMLHQDRVRCPLVGSWVFVTASSKKQC